MIFLGQSFELVVNFKPETATDKRLRYSFDYFGEESYEDCIMIQDGWITGLKLGYVGITVISLDNPNATAYCLVGVVEDKPTPTKKAGCFGSVETTSVILSSLSVLGIGLLLIKRRNLDK